MAHRQKICARFLTPALEKSENPCRGPAFGYQIAEGDRVRAGNDLTRSQAELLEMRLQSLVSCRLVLSNPHDALVAIRNIQQVAVPKIAVAAEIRGSALSTEMNFNQVIVSVDSQLIPIIIRKTEQSAIRNPRIAFSCLARVVNFLEPAS